MIYKNLVMTGAHTIDSPGLGPRGDLRAWDVRTGKLVWTFHSIPEPGEKGHETWLNDGWKNRSGTNAWTTFSVDAADRHGVRDVRFAGRRSVRRRPAGQRSVREFAGGSGRADRQD